MKHIKKILVVLFVLFGGLFVISNNKVYANGQETITFKFFEERPDEGLAKLDVSGMPDEITYNANAITIYHIDIPTATNYSFVGWVYYDNGVETFVKARDVFEEDTSFYAVWSLTIRTVTYVMNGGRNSIHNPYIFYGTDDYNLQPATRTGYDFGGWYDNQEFNGEPITYLGDGVKSLTLYAKWDDLFSVSFNLGYDGAIPIDPISVSKNETIDPLPAPERTGYSFDGWFDGENKFTTATQVTKNVTLDAKWTANKYNVTFNLNGGDSEQPAVKEVTFDQAYGILPEPTRTDHKFEGWYKEDLTTKWNFATDTVTEDITLYAKWTEDEGGGEDPQEPIIATLAYSGEESTNLNKVDNPTTALGLDDSVFTVSSIKGSAQNDIGLNAAGNIRLYFHANGGSTLIIEINDEYIITGIKITFLGTVGDTKVVLESYEETLIGNDWKNKAKEFSALAITEFSLQNVHSSNTQVWIESIEITYYPKA